MRPRETIAESKVSVKNQVVIPKAVVEELGIRPGDFLVFQKSGNEIVVRRGRITTD